MPRRAARSRMVVSYVHRCLSPDSGPQEAFAVALTLLPGHSLRSTTSGRWSEMPVGGVVARSTDAAKYGSIRMWSSWIFGVVDGYVGNRAATFQPLTIRATPGGRFR